MTFESEKPLIKEILFPLCDDNGKKKFNKIQELTSRKIMGSTSDLAIGKAISSIIESRSKHQLRLSQISFLFSLLFLPLQPEVLSLPCSVTVGILRLHFSWVNTYLKITQIHVQFYYQYNSRWHSLEHFHKQFVIAKYFTCFLSGPNFSNLTSPSIKENIVWSLPSPTFFPGWNWKFHFRLKSHRY